MTRRKNNAAPGSDDQQPESITEQINPTAIASSPTQEDWYWGRLATGGDVGGETGRAIARKVRHHTAIRAEIARPGQRARGRDRAQAQSKSGIVQSAPALR